MITPPLPARAGVPGGSVLAVGVDAACTQRPRRWQTSPVILDVQFNSATTPWPEMRDAVLAAEAAGYGVAWVVGHLAGQVMMGDSMMEYCTLTGALAASTTTIGVGTLVANVWNR